MQPFFSKQARAALRFVLAGVVLMPVLGSAIPAHAEQPAKKLFGRVAKPADLASRSIGSYARGCLAGAKPLPVTGQSWQVMRLSRNRNWGHPALIAYLERLAGDAAVSGDWPGLLVGDLAQPRGGPMLSGHNSHQIGLDADIWLTPMPNRVLTGQEREDISAISMLKSGKMEVDPAIFTLAHAKLLARAASYPEVARIFINPGIKRALCDIQWTDRTWLRKIRPWGGHHYHFHVRLNCPPDSAGCKNQDPPPPGDGCGAELDSWFLPPPKNPPKRKPKPELTLASLPRDCRTVLEVGGEASVNTVAQGRGGDPARIILDTIPSPRRRPAQ
ncbi:MAG: penicillin-insensitive murein endopeptidase [Rhodobiaceae bacterium]|nr:penicillin-insensitive murein endopeptidase [Rhodobiaceae bacterium]MCC0013887.1 penicillin-insensitive murein endopeptidase [Rhodobiaceae bacterium]MCC0017846.1 penicillin-insensitive murein endopeptidase [Rhodobiaceae bacterium]MCC0062449.1 penicillin-insensitive murein endopeptidase [Rhodobiaceae bacterium]